jgi:hypothetical protein
MKILYFLLFILRCALSFYDSEQLMTSVWLSGAAYCGKEKYETMTLGGPASGFIYKSTLYDIKTDIQGYIGIMPKLKTIYVVLRGSSSKMNWLDDFEVKLVPYITFPDCSCNVHNGFYRSVLGIRNKTIESVKLLQKIYPLYQVTISGHSYGASVGQLLSMELKSEGISNKIYNFGQPRVGDKKYADFVNTQINEYWRTTHNKDTVPHVPPILSFNYYHSCREIFEDENNMLHICSETNCEDTKCADQYKITQTNTEDHLYYLKHRLSCSDSTL